MGNVLCRGCKGKSSAGVSADAGPPQRSPTVVPHQGSLLTGDGGAGACGKLRPREQDGPEHGKSRRRLIGAESPGSAPEYLSNSRSESDSRVDRLKFEVTS